MKKILVFLLGYISVYGYSIDIKKIPVSTLDTYVKGYKYYIYLNADDQQLTFVIKNGSFFSGKADVYFLSLDYHTGGLKEKVKLIDKDVMTQMGLPNIRPLGTYRKGQELTSYFWAKGSQDRVMLFYIKYDLQGKILENITSIEVFDHTKLTIGSDQTQITFSENGKYAGIIFYSHEYNLNILPGSSGNGAIVQNKYILHQNRIVARTEQVTETKQVPSYYQHPHYIRIDKQPCAITNTGVLLSYFPEYTINSEIVPGSYNLWIFKPGMSECTVEENVYDLLEKGDARHVVNSIQVDEENGVIDLHAVIVDKKNVRSTIGVSTLSIDIETLDETNFIITAFEKQFTSELEKTSYWLSGWNTSTDLYLPYIASVGDQHYFMSGLSIKTKEGRSERWEPYLYFYMHTDRGESDYLKMPLQGYSSSSYGMFSNYKVLQGEGDTILIYINQVKKEVLDNQKIKKKPAPSQFESCILYIINNQVVKTDYFYHEGKKTGISYLRNARNYDKKHDIVETYVYIEKKGPYLVYY